MFSDFILSKQPSTVEETLEIYKDITKNFGTLSNKHKFASPMYVKLTPLKFVSKIKQKASLIPNSRVQLTPMFIKSKIPNRI